LPNDLVRRLAIGDTGNQSVRQSCRISFPIVQLDSTGRHFSKGLSDVHMYGRSRRTDADIDLAFTHLDLHLARAARAFDQLKRLAFIFRCELQEGREKVFAVPSDAKDL
jgi:hypothetical protein